MKKTGPQIMKPSALYPRTWTFARQACGRELSFAFVGEIPEEEDQGRYLRCREARTVRIITLFSLN